MDRILQNTSSTIRVTFALDGTPTNATGPVLVTIRRDDGTVLANAATATQPGPTGVYETVVSSANASLLDILSADWTGTISGNSQTIRTTIEVVGGFLFSIAQARDRLPDATAYPTADLIAARNLLEESFEDYAGVAFVPRYARERFSGAGTTIHVASKPKIRKIRSAKLDGVAVSTADLTSILPVSHSFYYPNSWGWGVGNYEITYEHGMDRPPAAITNAALDELTDLLSNSGTQYHPYATEIRTDGGVMRLGQPASLSQRSRAVLDEYSYSIGVA